MSEALTVATPNSASASKPQLRLVADAAPVSLTAQNVVKTYHRGPESVPVLRGVDFCVEPGEFVAITGQSGSGKSTLLHLLGLLDKPDEGEIVLDGSRIDNLSSRRRDHLRNSTFGMIFQFYHLLPELSALENVLAPAMIGSGLLRYWGKRGEYRERAKNLLDLVGLDHRMKHKPRELSGGEMQRAAVARALMSMPRVLLADEPTGNLDPANGREVLELMHRLNAEQGLTIVMVTHDEKTAAGAHRRVRLENGRLEEKSQQR